MPKSLEEQLKDIEDAEARLRPLIIEARQAFQDLKAARGEIRREIEKAAEEEIQGIVNAQIQILVAEFRELKAKLRDDLNEQVVPILDLLKEVKARYARIGAQYESLEAHLEVGGFEVSNEFAIPVPSSTKERRKT